MAASLLIVRPQRLPARLVCWPLPASLLADLTAAVPAAVEIRHVRTLVESRAAVASSTDACVIATVPADPHSGLLDDLASLRGDFPHVPIIAIAVAGESAFQSAWRLGRAAVTEVLTADPRLRVDDLLATLTRAHADGVIAALWRSAQLTLPDALVTVMRRALRSAHAPFTAEALAQHSKMNERSLRKYCTRHQLPTPQILVGWARLLLAAYYLDERGRSLKDIAEMLGYPTPGALRKQIHRYTGRSTGELRADGALRTVASLLQSCLVPEQTLPPAAGLSLVRADGSVQRARW